MKNSIFRVCLKDSTLPHESGSFWLRLNKVVKHYYDFVYDDYLHVVIHDEFVDDFILFCRKYNIRYHKYDLLVSLGPGESSNF